MYVKGKPVRQALEEMVSQWPDWYLLHELREDRRSLHGGTRGNRVLIHTRLRAEVIAAELARREEAAAETPVREYAP